MLIFDEYWHDAFDIMSFAFPRDNIEDADFIWQERKLIQSCARIFFAVVSTQLFSFSSIMAARCLIPLLILVQLCYQGNRSSVCYQCISYTLGSAMIFCFELVGCIC